MYNRYSLKAQVNVSLSKIKVI